MKEAALECHFHVLGDLKVANLSEVERPVNIFPALFRMHNSTHLARKLAGKAVLIRWKGLI